MNQNGPKRLFKFNPRALVGWILFIGVLTLAFQNCKESESGGGNGSGYAGLRVKPGTFYATSEDTRCYSNQQQKQTQINGIIKVNRQGQMIYFKGCDETGGKTIPMADVKVSAANNQLITYKKSGGHFEWLKQPPELGNFDRLIETVCYVEWPLPVENPSESHVYYLGNMQVVVRKPNATTKTSEVYYDKVSGDYMDLKLFFLPGFEVTYKGDPDLGTPLRYQNGGSPFLDLDLLAPDIPEDPVREGSLKIEIDGQIKETTINFCLMNFPGVEITEL